MGTPHFKRLPLDLVTLPRDNPLLKKWLYSIYKHALDGTRPTLVAPNSNNYFKFLRACWERG